MKLLFTLMLFILIPACYSKDRIQCFSSGKLIYNNEVINIYYDDSVVFFTEKKSKKLMMTNSECIVEVSEETKNLHKK